MGGTGNGGIGSAGSPVEQQMDRPTAAAGEKLSGNPLMGPGQITASACRDHKGSSGGECGPGRNKNSHGISCHK